MATELLNLPGVNIAEQTIPGGKRVLTPDALAFVTALERKFGNRRRELLQQRTNRQEAINQGSLPDFLLETSGVREGNWHIDPVPADLRDRRVEITGPAGDRKMVINALNSGAKVFMADFEDANSPTWGNTVSGQVNLMDAVSRTISYVNPQGKQYQLKEQVAVLVVRPRGWHMEERHMQVDGQPVSAALFDFGLYLFHNAKELLVRGSGPYFYLPKMEHYLEARLWNDVFTEAESWLGLPAGCIKATVLIETILAAFQMDEILYELRHHAAGLNCGRWDYIFSFIKKFHRHEKFLFPDRARVTMTSPCMRAYSLLAIQTCHKRGAHAIGGMAAQIPVKDDEVANRHAFEQVRQDKVREATDGHDGTWVAHPGLVPGAMEAFNTHMPTPNQVDRLRDDVVVTAADLLEVPQGEITEAGLRNNLSVAVQYMEAWLRGSGAVPINHLMEDAATAEISRTQVWQWIRHPRGVLSDGRKVTLELVRQWLDEERASLQARLGEHVFAAGRFEEAFTLFWQLTVADELTDFFTLPGYRKLEN